MPRIRIKRRLGSNADPPSLDDLYAGELAYNDNGDTLYVSNGSSVRKLIGSDRQLEITGIQAVPNGAGNAKTFDLSNFKLKGGEPGNVLIMVDGATGEVAWAEELTNFTIIGVTDGSEAPPGQVGELEVITGDVTSIASIETGPAPALAGTLNLTPGDWQIVGSVLFTHSGGGSTQRVTVGYLSYIENRVLIPHPTLSNFDYVSAWVGVLNAGDTVTIPLPTLRWLSTQALPVQLGYYSFRNAGTCVARVRMQALRVR